MSDPYFHWAFHHPEDAACPCDCQARAAAFAAGVEEGQSMDMYATAHWDMTHLATMLNDRQLVTVLRRLERFLTWAEQQVESRAVLDEAEQGSALWPTVPIDELEQLPF